MSLIKKLFRLLAIIVHVLWGVMQVIFSFKGKISPTTVDQIIIKHWFVRFLQLLQVQTRVHGSIDHKPQLMIANHISWIDILLLNSIYPARFIAKSEIKKWPIVGWLAKKVGTVFVKRGNITDIRRLNKQIYQLLSAGEKVTLFPEGGTSNGQAIQHLYPGLFQSVIPSSEEQALGVQPLVIIYTVNGQLSSTLPFVGDTHVLANFWAILGMKPITADIYITPSIDATDHTRKSLSECTQKQMQNQLDNQLKAIKVLSD
jgi:1-acyl-sn-glycerol-3-phosphate acyltransferase